MSKPQPSHSPQRLTKSLLALSLFSLSASITACSPPEESAEYSAGDFTSEGGSASNYAPPPGPPSPPAPEYYPEAGSTAGAEMWEESAGGADLIAPDIDEPEPEPELEPQAQERHTKRAKKPRVGLAGRFSMTQRALREQLMMSGYQPVQLTGSVKVESLSFVILGGGSEAERQRARCERAHVRVYSELEGLQHITSPS